MEKVHDNKIKMKPKIYFVVGSLLTFIGLIISIIASVFLMGLVRFSLRSHGMMRGYRLDQMISSFPWWIIIFAIITLLLGIWLIRKYDFSYKINPWHMILGLIITIIIAGWVIDLIGINDTLSKRGPMRGMMRRSIIQNINLPQPQMFRN